MGLTVIVGESPWPLGSKTASRQAWTRAVAESLHQTPKPTPSSTQSSNKATSSNSSHILELDKYLQAELQYTSGLPVPACLNIDVYIRSSQRQRLPKREFSSSGDQEAQCVQQCFSWIHNVRITKKLPGNAAYWSHSFVESEERISQVPLAPFNEICVNTLPR